MAHAQRAAEALWLQQPCVLCCVRRFEGKGFVVVLTLNYCTIS